MKDSIEMGRQTGDIEIQLRKDSIGIQKIKTGIVIHMPHRQHIDPSDKNSEPTACPFSSDAKKTGKERLKDQTA